MNMGDEKGTDVLTVSLSLPGPHGMFMVSTSFVFVCVTGCILDSVVSEVNPTYVLELGTYCGYSTVRIARLLPPRAKVITLEFNPEFAAIARQVISWAGVEEKVK